MSHEPVSIIGAGPVGCLLATHLAVRGHSVTIYERRPDIRRAKIAAGRSINLALSVRGIHALSELGVEGRILERAIPMYGRMMHAPDGALTFQRYGLDDSQFINSISRAELNRALLDHAESVAGVSVNFERRLTGYDFATKRLSLHDEAGGVSTNVAAPVVIGSDGSASALRESMRSHLGATMGANEDSLDYGYKELTIPAAAGGGFAMEKNALHIWPRGSHMLIALPNFDGSFTCTLFLPWRGPQSFAALTTPAAVNEFFKTYYDDARAQIGDLATAFFENPTGHMVTVNTRPWHVDGQVLLIGDAAHAIVPFFGQGLNAGFEDCSILRGLLGESATFSETFARFYETRKPDADAIATLALENFVEMRDKVGQPRFLLEKEIEKRLMTAYPDLYVSRYSLVTFSRKPYRMALRAGRAQDKILARLSEGIGHADEVDLAAARTLIETELTPVLNARV